jgi:hypothetical protein
MTFAAALLVGRAIRPTRQGDIVQDERELC